MNHRARRVLNGTGGILSTMWSPKPCQPTNAIRPRAVIAARPSIFRWFSDLLLVRRDARGRARNSCAEPSKPRPCGLKGTRSVSRPKAYPLRNALSF